MSSIDSTGAFRITGAVVSLAELAKNRPGMVIKATDEQIAEMKLHEEQVRARQEAGDRYAKQHQDKVFGQVVVNGKLFATVYDSGVASTPYQMSMTNDGFGTSLAQTRLKEIAKAANGTIIYSDFFPAPEGSYRGAPESKLPPITARSIVDFARELSWQSERSRIAIMDQAPKVQDALFEESKVK